MPIRFRSTLLYLCQIDLIAIHLHMQLCNDSIQCQLCARKPVEAEKRRFVCVTSRIISENWIVDDGKLNHRFTTKPVGNITRAMWIMFHVTQCSVSILFTATCKQWVSAEGGLDAYSRQIKGTGELKWTSLEHDSCMLVIVDFTNYTSLGRIFRKLYLILLANLLASRFKNFLMRIEKINSYASNSVSDPVQTVYGDNTFFLVLPKATVKYEQFFEYFHANGCKTDFTEMKNVLWQWRLVPQELRLSGTSSTVP